jgi:hypothetical protein
LDEITIILHQGLDPEHEVLQAVTTISLLRLLILSFILWTMGSELF